jgi:hypothetical protein
MTAPGNGTSNVASGSASVGVQAGVVHNVTLYQVPPDATPTVSRTTLDAAGLDNTLHVLEGIAAEGKQWIPHERRRAEGRLGKLTSILHRIVGDEAEPGSAGL